MGAAMRASLAEAALVTAVRTFEQGGAEAFPEKLEEIWNIISQGTGSFHAAEEMLVRGLLKNMNGTDPDAERLRRYPLTWSVLGAAFARIPAFPLAKSLADRKFLSILHQTLKDISCRDFQPVKAATRKRKRSGPLTFDLASQRKLPYCMQSSEAVFQALRALLSRCWSPAGQTATNPMGIEPIKALFFTSAFESMEILVPLLNICALALQNGRTEMYDGQAGWISTLTSLWDLHRQADSDALEVATHLTALGSRLLEKLSDSAPGAGQAVGDRWTRELRRFLTRSLILPSRAAFFNRGSSEAIQFAVEVNNSTKATTCAVLFDLVLSAPKAIGGDRTTKRGNDSWVQAVFDILEPAVRELDGNRDRIIGDMLTMVAEHAASLKLHSLAEICSEYALEGGRPDWKLLLYLVKLNPDVFLLPSGGKDLLGPALSATARLDSGQHDFESAVQFLCLLARGYSEARDLPVFIQKWLHYLTLPTLEPLGGYFGDTWSRIELVETVAEVLQSSMNPHQLLALLHWLEAQADSAQALPRMRILAAISRSLSQEEFVDAVGTKLHDIASLSATPKAGAEIQETLDLRCTIGERTMSWSTLEQTERIWKELSEIMSLRETFTGSQASIAAFKFSARAWMCQYPGGRFEAEAARSTCAIIDDLDENYEKPGKRHVGCGSCRVSGQEALCWTISEVPRVLGLYVKQKGHLSPAILALLSLPQRIASSTPAEAGGLAGLMFGYGGDAANKPLMSDLLAHLILVIRDNGIGISSSEGQAAIHSLLQIPLDFIYREQREAIMRVLMTRISHGEHITMDCWMPVLSLMIKLMSRPTFYEGMGFDELVCAARSIVEITSSSNEGRPADGLLGTRQIVRLLDELATLTLRQMTRTVEQREKTYIEHAVSVLRAAKKHDELDYSQLVLLRAGCAVLQDSPATKQLGLDLPDLMAQLLDKVTKSIGSICDGLSQQPAGKNLGNGKLLNLLIAVRAADVLPTGALAVLRPQASQLRAYGTQLVRDGAKAGWEIRSFLARHCSDKAETSLDLEIPDFVTTDAGGVSEKSTATGLPVVDQDAILDYVDAMTQSTDEDTRLEQLETLLTRMKEGSNKLDQLVAVNQLVQREKDARASDATANAARCLSRIHSAACEMMKTTETLGGFILAAETTHLLLAKRATAMTQWNIELTLGAVSTICSEITARHPAATCPKSFKWLTSLVAIVIKRHRKRLDGHFHLLIAALESLFHVLVRHPYDATGKNKAAGPVRDTACFPYWVQHAKLFARLLTLVCEPSVASVSRSQSNALDSEKDRAKRYAAQYMYQVLMCYVQLQLEHVVPHAVREVLEPGLYSVLDVTPPESLRIMSDAMDLSGRAVMKELYRQHQKFGKWTGV